MPTLEAPARYCPACGGPDGERSDSTCRFCGAPRLPLGVPDPRSSILCGACGTAMPGGASFCMACGGGLARLPATAGKSPPCPGCGGGQMETCGLAPTAGLPQGHRVLSCLRCGGVWLPTATRQALIAAAVRSAEHREPGTAPNRVARRQLPPGALAAKVVYRRCPECAQSMTRRNFGGCSGVVIDECTHGSFFDAGELADMLEFVRTGGLALTREREQLERARAVRNAAGSAPRLGTLDEDSGDVASAFVRWAGRFLDAFL